MVQEEVTDTAVCRVMRGYSNRTQPYNKLHAQVIKFSSFSSNWLSFDIEILITISTR